MPVGKVVISEQQSAEGSRMSQRRGQSPPWEHCGWLCFAEPGRSAEAVGRGCCAHLDSWKGPLPEGALSTEHMNASKNVT